MNLSVTPATHRSAAPRPVRRPHTPLSAIDPLGAAAVRSAGRVTDIPGRRPVKPITFDSAL
ncbi:hypothetical protein AB0D27_08135 [Streptomyces sp. NPDC048415]|jgi:hypothetical protein|uniref:hypothetical protein n=1 Tax=Streptomyces sp. NPDC048415 TaxID=3154822 RepID=UPI0034241159